MTLPHHLQHLLAALAVAFPLAAQDPAPLPPDRAPGAGQITEERLREWLGHLASPELGGRGTGQPGFEKAAEYVRDHFAELGLEPGAADGSYFQAVPWVRVGPVLERSGVKVSHGGDVVWQADLEALRGAASQDEEVTGPLVFAVTGARDGADLAQLDLKGAAVVVVPRRGVFSAQDLDGPRGRYRALRDATQIRQSVADAGGQLLLVADDTIAGIAGTFAPRTSEDRPGGSGRVSRGRGRMPTLTAIDEQGLEALSTAVGVSEDLHAHEAPAKLAVEGATAELAIDIETTPAPAYNVLAILRGSDPQLADQFVGIGSHLDHLGTNAEGVIHPGADDDGSGSAGLMAIASAFAKNPERPARSILFMAFCGEENGLVGSRYFATNPTIPLEQMVAELQIDMIGRNEQSDRETAEDNQNSLHLIGTQKLSPDLHELCLELNERAGFDLEWDEENVFYRSDHWNFARLGVPVAFFFTGFHPDYHRPSDTPDKIEYAKLARIATYVYDLAWELADREQRPLIEPARWEALERKGRAEPLAPLDK